ncbi:Cytochrome P450 4V2 [Araneus ventricosus]|uniref:Cytochrome P450 4V2 n=1 Tax=Araneus ventricosus TaxID=182803 RepID=A0A4Y2QFE5_ARAVE|nr:Cytochrome P450 4V2 [Araneus ventricosus]
MPRRFMNVFLWPDLIFNFSKTGREIRKHSQDARDFTRDLIEKEKQNFLEHSQPSEKEGKSLVKLLLKEYYLSKEMSEEDIRDQLMTFMIAGQDTTKIALNWILYMLGLHAGIQAKVHEELDLIFGVDHERHATVEDLKNMKYLECVIKETFRIYPPGPVLPRYLNEDTTICGYQIPKGTICAVFPHVLHRDEKVFPNPEKFDPDRFLPENSATRHPYAYIPFSAGPRNCIGQKLAELLDRQDHHILRGTHRIIGSEGSRASHSEHRSRLVYTYQNQDSTASLKGKLATLIVGIRFIVIGCDILNPSLLFLFIFFLRPCA